MRVLELWDNDLGRFVWCGIVIDAESDLAASELAARMVRAAGLGQRPYRVRKANYIYGGTVVSAGYEAIFV